MAPPQGGGSPGAGSQGSSQQGGHGGGGTQQGGKGGSDKGPAMPLSQWATETLAHDGWLMAAFVVAWAAGGTGCRLRGKGRAGRLLTVEPMDCLRFGQGGTTDGLQARETNSSKRQLDGAGCDGECFNGATQRAQRSYVIPSRQYYRAPTLAPAPTAPPPPVNPAAPGVALLVWAFAFDAVMSLASLLKAPASKARQLARMQSSSSLK